MGSTAKWTRQRKEYGVLESRLIESIPGEGWRNGSSARALPKHKALSSNPSTNNKNEGGGEGGRERKRERINAEKLKQIP
jgi:hypothetical protein